MQQKRTGKFQKKGLRGLIGGKGVVVALIALMLSGCGMGVQGLPGIEPIMPDSEACPSGGEKTAAGEYTAGTGTRKESGKAANLEGAVGVGAWDESGESAAGEHTVGIGRDSHDKTGKAAAGEHIAAIYRDIRDEAVKSDPPGSLETTRRIIEKLGENGYVAVDSGNQLDMAEAGQVLEFCRAVEEKEPAAFTAIVLMGAGFRKYDLTTEDGRVDIFREYYQYSQDGQLQKRSQSGYSADVWELTEEGYLIFSGRYFSEDSYVLTLSDTQEHTALRVLPLDQTCRELNRKYILPVAYEQNNLFLCNWSEDDFGALDFYDVFDRCWPLLYGKPFPYAAAKCVVTETACMIPQDLFEKVIKTCLNIDAETLRTRTKYNPQQRAYEYFPRSFYEAENPEILYPEVVDYTENQDGTITLTVNAVYPHEDTSRSFSHKTVIRPLGENQFQYVSNEVVSQEDTEGFWWRRERLTEEERAEYSTGGSPENGIK